MVEQTRAKALSSTTKELAASWYQHYPSDHPTKAGQVIERRRTCECGRAFTQWLLSERQLAAVERMGIMELFQRQIPDFYVPAHCPPCESKDLGRRARVDEARAVPARREYAR